MPASQPDDNAIQRPRRAWIAWAEAAVAILIFSIAAYAIGRDLRGVAWPQIEGALGSVPPDGLVVALLALAASLVASSTYDSLGLAALGKPAPWRVTRLTSGIAFVLANVGAAGLAGASAARFRAYQGLGLAGAETVILSAVVAGTGLIGGLALVGLGAAGSLSQIAATAHLPGVLGLALAIFGLKGLASFLLAPRIGFLRGLLPARRVRLGMVLASSAEWTAAACILYVLLPAETRGPLLQFLPVFGLAGLVGAVSGLPGGIGPFDAVVLAVLGPRVGAAETAAALLAYRLVYVVTPLLLVAGAIAASATRGGLARGGRRLTELRQTWMAVAPAAFAVLTFAAGVLMLVSVATPEEASRLKLLARLAPPGLVDLSHLVASLAAVCLLFVAFGIKARRRRAYRAGLALLMTAAGGALLKGLDYEEAVFLLALAGLLYSARDAFYRGEGATILTPRAMAAIAVALIAAGWLGLFAYQHVAYRDELWWTFVTDQGAPRFLRASVAAAGLALVLACWRLTRPAPSPPGPATRDDLERAAAALAGAERATPDANLAFLGDKRLLFSASGRSFVQYGAQGGTWIAMGEPVGPLGERHEMIWAFRELCDRNGARPIFYAVSRESVPEFVDCGLVASKIGETALVDLPSFALEGSARAGLRHAFNRADRAGLAFDVVPPSAFDSVADDLKAVSDAWLALHQGGEKGFSLGRFDPDYLRRFPTAVLRLDNRVVAFANLWITPDRRVLSVDLMRYGGEAPKNTMDALFIHLMLWGREQGYAMFDLGMAPLAGLEEHRLAPMATRIAALVYRQAGGLYGFEGLRAFKDKFGPRWEPVYIAAPATWLLGPALADAALLSSGGVMGLLR
ncbi:bifunctional lysylphosphatidylglycerol flippase/synthetase MprF [Brevundimonas sp.]|uniref:bifunctional lysylphosphatidylglycerol flippase/synthetase MprF n=1 Tax=Brevundimonas sp. TaxID=1871086 RepID=UPI002D57EC8B|nr:bifunctional lysylphosphatidylglycerol flippase/synthetase MprF [Brevundimonas sp.]HYC96833.1 bifunctional lysylphosphatidylglycerol flippase/synthetase MprF [Brevundimonas sp.]